jgi:hypothetical protein
MSSSTYPTIDPHLGTATKPGRPIKGSTRALHRRLPQCIPKAATFAVFSPNAAAFIDIIMAMHDRVSIFVFAHLIGIHVSSSVL